MAEGNHPLIPLDDSTPTSPGQPPVPRSPPTSPAVRSPARSPPTSPAVRSPARFPARSPPTSPAVRSPSTSPPVRSLPTPRYMSSSSPSSCGSNTSGSSAILPTKKRKEVCRRTINRREKLLRVSSSFSDNDEDDDDDAVSLSVMQVVEENETHGNDGADFQLEVNEDHVEGCVQQQTVHLRRSSDKNVGEHVSDSDLSSSESGASNISSVNSRGSSSTHVLNLSRTSESTDSVNQQSDVSSESVQNLFDGSGMTANECLLKVFKLFVEERWTKTSLDKTLKLFKKILPQPNGLPTSGKAALKKLEQLTSSCCENEYSYCKECFQLSETCDHDAGCGNYFSFPVGEQVKHMFEHRGLASVIEYYHNHRNKDNQLICDITDGTEYQRIKNSFHDLYDLLILLWNTDGLALSSSSKQEIWLILCTISEVPPSLRPSFMIVAGVYVGEHKPDMNVFLNPFSNQLKRLWENGISWVHPVSNEVFVSKIIAPALSADAPAKAMVVKMQNFNSKYGCNTCEQKSQKVQLSAEETEFNQNITDKRKKKRRKRRFVFQEDEASPALRTGPRMDLLGDFAEQRERPCRGVMGRAVVSQIPLFDRGVSVCAEYLHLILLGVVKYLLMIIFFQRGPWYLGDKIDEIDKIIHSIRVPDYIKRVPHGINDLKFWKASELRSFLLYYSLPIFKNLFPEKYFQHWFLLVASTFIFLKDAITGDDLRAGEIMITAFVRSVGPLYGDSSYTYNVHTFHVPLLVKRWGPLWSTSAFVFESFNGYVSAHVHGTKNLGKELIESIKIYQRVAILNRIVNSPPLDFRSSLHVTEPIGKCLPLNSLAHAEQVALNSHGHLGNYVLYGRARIKSIIFTSREYDEDKRRSNSYIQFFSDENQQQCHGQIVIFVKAENGSLLFFVKLFKVIHVNLFFHHQSRYVLRHLVPVEELDEFCVVPVEHVSLKVLRVGMYFAMYPNLYEVNL